MDNKKINNSGETTLDSFKLVNSADKAGYCKLFIELSDGTKGQVSAKSEKPSYCVVGAKVAYMWKTGNYGEFLTCKLNSDVTNSQTPDAAQAKGDYWGDKLALDKARFEFDKQKQRLIVLQSTLKEANLYYGTHGKEGDPITPMAVYSLAETWTDEIMGKPREELNPPSANKTVEKFERPVDDTPPINESDLPY